MSGRVVVIGGGHNGLVASAWLARQGRPVVLLEAREVLGGVAARETFGEQYAVPGLLHDTQGFRAWVASGLGLEQHGLRRLSTAPRITAPGGDDGGVVIAGEQLVGADDETERYLALRGFLARVSPVLRRLMDRPALDPLGGLWPLLRTGWAVRRLGPRDMTELMRIAPMCVADWMRDTFRSERLSAALAAPALEGAFTGPWSAGTAANLLIRECTSDGEVAGGPAAVTAALEKAARAYGVDIRTSAPIKRIELDGDRVSGVTLSNGDVVEATSIVSTLDPRRTFLKLIGAERLPARLSWAVGNIRMRGTTAKVHLGLDGPLETAGGQPVEVMRTGATLDELERAHDAAKYRRFATTPRLDVRAWSSHIEGLGPEGHHVVSILAHSAPYDLEGGWTDAQREALGDAVVDTLARHCPGVGQRVVAREVLTPADLETRYGLTGGHVHHGEHAPDQLLFMRPTIDLAGYRSPISGLYLGGSGCHPGGGITGAPGALAAKAVLLGA